MTIDITKSSCIMIIWYASRNVASSTLNPVDSLKDALRSTVYSQTFGRAAIWVTQSTCSPTKQTNRRNIGVPHKTVWQEERRRPLRKPEEFIRVESTQNYWKQRKLDRTENWAQMWEENQENRKFEGKSDTRERTQGTQEKRNENHATERNLEGCWNVGSWFRSGSRGQLKVKET